MNNPTIFNDLSPEPATPDCKGIVCRYLTTTFISRRGFATTARFNILKRKSCPGCAICGPLLDAVECNIQDMGIGIVLSEPVSSGALVKLRFVVDGYEYEEGYQTQYVDDYHIEATPYTEEEEPQCSTC